MYEIRFSNEFKNDLKSLKSFEYLIADHLKIFITNPFDSRLKTKVSRDVLFYGSYKSEISNKLTIYWKYWGAGSVFLIKVVRKG